MHPSLLLAAALQLVPLSPPVVGASIAPCAAPYVPAAVRYAAPADLPAIAVGQRATGIAGVRIALDGRGRLTEASVLRSSGNPWIDAAALLAARSSTYRAEVRDCAGADGVYALLVDFGEGG